MPTTNNICEHCNIKPVCLKYATIVNNQRWRQVACGFSDIRKAEGICHGNDDPFNSRIINFTISENSYTLIC